MTWEQHLTDEERKRLKEIDEERKQLTDERRRIYDRARRRTMDNSSGVRFTTKQGFVFVVDQEDVERMKVYNWNALSLNSGRHQRFAPYIQGVRKGDSKDRVYLHRFLMDAPEGMVVDHIDGNPLNNCKANLRVTTQKINGQAWGKMAKERNGHLSI